MFQTFTMPVNAYYIGSLYVLLYAITPCCCVQVSVLSFIRHIQWQKTIIVIHLLRVCVFGCILFVVVIWMSISLLLCGNSFQLSLWPIQSFMFVNLEIRSIKMFCASTATATAIATPETLHGSYHEHRPNGKRQLYLPNHSFLQSTAQFS